MGAGREELTVTHVLEKSALWKSPLSVTVTPMCSNSLCEMRQRSSSWQEVARGLQALAEELTRAHTCESYPRHSQLPPIQQWPLRLGLQDHKNQAQKSLGNRKTHTGSCGHGKSFMYSTNTNQHLHRHQGYQVNKTNVPPAFQKLKTHAHAY